MLTMRNVSYSIGGRCILDDISFQVGGKQHVGFVGRNGSGKSTLFNIINNKLVSDGGKIEISKGYKILAVKQEMPEGDLSVVDYLLSQDVERNALMQALETCVDAEKMADIYDRLIQIDAYSAESRAAVVLNGLGFPEEDQQRSVNTFSGGWRMRMSLASILYQNPDLLLLDEPTNHLDFETSYWLEDFLNKYPKSFILISHDRDFLNSSINSVLHLKNSKITRYTGNFDTFIDVYNLQQQNAESFNKKVAEKQKHMMEFVNKFRAKATKAKQAQSRIKAIEKMKFMHVEPDDPTVHFNFPKVDSIPPPILSFDKVMLGYGEKVVIKSVSASIMPYDRIALVGHNGSGKSTFAKFLAGELLAKKGERHESHRIKIGFYKQDQFETLNVNITAYEHVKSHMENNPTDSQIRNHLGRFGFSKDKADQLVHNLSGGERARLLFASLTAVSPNLLILDEPTNHLDMEMRESLIESLATYDGAVIIISHDKNLLNRVADTVLLVKNNKVTAFDGDLSEYETFVKNASGIKCSK